MFLRLAWESLTPDCFYIACAPPWQPLDWGLMKSMTGFGRGEASGVGLGFRAEVASVNRKQTDIVVSMPRELAELDARVRKLVAGAVSRGRVTANIGLIAETSGTAKVQVDEALALQYVEALQALSPKVDLTLVDGFDPMRAPGVITLGESLPEPEDAWPVIEAALTTALEALVGMRSTEGANLKKDMEAKLERLRGLVATVAERAPEVPARYRENLFKRLSDAGLELDLNDERVLREIGLFADRCDLSEELARLDSHFAQCAKYFASDEAVGRPLDFLAQEINRELNTIGSKANDATIAQAVVEAKTELEKIREQVQNVE